MEYRNITRGSEWLYFRPRGQSEKCKIQKKVFLIDRFRSHLMLEALRAEALSDTPDFSTGFSYIKVANTTSIKTRGIIDQVKEAGRQL